MRELETKSVATLAGDVADEDFARHTMALAQQRFGGVDILVNNAGRTLNKSLIDTSVEEWDAILATNARAQLRTFAISSATMLENGGGTIVPVVSVAATIAMKELAAYSASKGAHNATHEGDRG